MCHWIRDAEFERGRASSTVPPSHPLNAPPRRLVGALAAIGAVAVAAMLLLPAAPPADASPPQAAAAVPESVATPTVPAAGVHTTAVAPDDPAPVSTTARSAGSHCSHDL